MELAEQKRQLFEALKFTKALQNLDSTDKNWQKAFSLYAENQGERLDLGCGKCYAKVAEWLQK